jgi:hypothetical protein
MINVAARSNVQWEWNIEVRDLEVETPWSVAQNQGLHGPPQRGSNVRAARGQASRE